MKVERGKHEPGFRYPERVAERHERMLALDRQGLNRKEIAVALRISRFTVGDHLAGRCGCKETR